MYRANSVEAQRQADAIITADQASKPVDKDISRLKTYTKLHMNTSVSFALQGSYSRAVAAAQAAALQQTQSGAKVYTDAQAACSAKVDSIQLSNCVTGYIAARATPTQPTVPTSTVDKNQFIYSFLSPTWTFDLAGIIITLGILLLVGCLFAVGMAATSQSRKY